MARGMPKVMTSGTPRNYDQATASQRSPDDQSGENQHAAEEVAYHPRHETVSAAAHAGTRALYSPGNASDWSADEEALRRRQLAGLSALITLAKRTTVTETFSALPLAPSTRPRPEKPGRRILTLLKDPALRGAFALITSALGAGGLGFVFWVATAHYQSAAAVGSVSAEVSAITFLASVGSLNLINVFARFLPEAGWNSRRMIILSYGASVVAGLLFGIIFLMTPLATGRILGGQFGRLGFVLCVVLTSVFMIQDGGLVGFGRSGWVPIENILVALGRLALLPLTAVFLSAKIGILWSWAVPMVISVIVVNFLNIGLLAGRQAKQRPNLPKIGELSHFIAIESVTTAISAAVSAFLPFLVVRRLGAIQGGYFYVPWIITTMASALLAGIMISMVREAVASPEKAANTIRRSLGLVTLAVILGTLGCLFLAQLILTPMGPEYVAHGVPLLRWIGLALPATAVNLLFWATCLVRRRPWPVFAVNLTTSVTIIGGVLLLKPGSEISAVGMVYCLAQWMVAVVTVVPTFKALRAIRKGTQ